MTEKGKQPSVGTFLNRQSMQSTEFMREQAYRMNIRASSNKSSIMSDAEKVSSSCNTTGFSPLKQAAGMSGDIVNRDSYVSPRGRQKYQLQGNSNSDLQNQSIAVEISRRRFEDSARRTTDRPFIP